MEELYENLYGTNFTLISNEFLEKFLYDTKPEYIKVFLFYLWKGIKERYTIKDASNALDLTESDVEMALKFWVKKKLMKEECIRHEKDTKKNLIDFQTKKNELLNKNRKNYIDIEKDLLFAAEKLLGQTLTERQVALIAKCYNEYGFSEELIEYLFEYCGSIGKTDCRYIANVADTWYEQGLKNVDEAKSHVASYTASKNKFQKKNNNHRVLDRQDDYSKILFDSISSGNFK